MILSIIKTVIVLDEFMNFIVKEERKLNDFVPLKTYPKRNGTILESCETNQYRTAINVNALRPRDIRVVGALGDSHTAAMGAKVRPGDMLGSLFENRGLSFSVGKGDGQALTILRILTLYNATLTGASTDKGSSIFSLEHELNVAVSGARSTDLVNQANELVRRIEEHPSIDVLNDWKLISIFIGANDICAYCLNPTAHSAEAVQINLRAAIKIIRNKLPRTLVQIVGSMHVKMLKHLYEEYPECESSHWVFCGACAGKDHFTYPTELFENIEEGYHQAAQAIADDRQLSRYDFTVVYQPFLRHVIEAPKLQSGHVDRSLFATDCIHFSAIGHSRLAAHLWLNMMQPTYRKTTKVDLASQIPLATPDSKCPFIRTNANSENCREYYYLRSKCA